MTVLVAEVVVERLNPKLLAWANHFCLSPVSRDGAIPRHRGADLPFVVQRLAT